MLRCLVEKHYKRYSEREGEVEKKKKQEVLSGGSSVWFSLLQSAFFTKSFFCMILLSGQTSVGTDRAIQRGASSAACNDETSMTSYALRSKALVTAPRASSKYQWRGGTHTLSSAIEVRCAELFFLSSSFPPSLFSLEQEQERDRERKG